MQTSYNPLEKRIEVTIPAGKKVGVTMTIHGGSFKQIYFGAVSDPYGTYYKIFDSTLDPSDPCFLPHPPTAPASYFLYPGTSSMYIMPVYELLGAPDVEKYFSNPTLPGNPNAANQSYTFTVSQNPQDDITIQMIESAGGGPAKK